MAGRLVVAFCCKLVADHVSPSDSAWDIPIAAFCVYLVLKGNVNYNIEGRIGQNRMFVLSKYVT